MNKYQNRIDTLRNAIYNDIKGVMMQHKASEVSIPDDRRVYFIGEYGDDVADYEISKLILSEKGGLYVEANNKWNEQVEKFSVKYEFGFHDLYVLNELFITVNDVLTKLSPKKIKLTGNYIEICNNKVVKLQN